MSSVSLRHQNVTDRTFHPFVQILICANAYLKMLVISQLNYVATDIYGRNKELGKMRHFKCCFS